MSNSPWQVQIVRSARRYKTLTARLVGEHSVEVRVPLGMSQAREREAVGRLMERLKARVAPGPNGRATATSWPAPRS